MDDARGAAMSARVGSRWQRAAVLVLVLAGAAAARAEVVVGARLDRSQTGVGEPVDLAVEIRGAQSVAVPQVPNVQGLSIRYLGPSTHFTIVNGRAASSMTHHFAVSPLRTGRFTIGPIRVDHDGRQYDAGSVTLEAGAQGSAGGGPDGDQLRLMLAAPRTTVWLHERVPLTVTLTVGNVQVSDVDYPTVPGDGFALARFPVPAQRREQTATGDVEIAEFSTALTPLRSGALTVGPATLELTVITRGTRRGRDPFFDSFFGGARRQPLTLTSEPLVLTVRPLPQEGKPADFSGAVGTFELEVTAAPLAPAAGDPVTITTVIRGTGYLEGLTPPALPTSDGLRVYPVQQPPAPSPVARAHGLEERRFEQVVIPQRAGTTTLPAIRFSTFDP